MLLTVPGIRSDGSENTDLLSKRIAELGFETHDVDYPQINFLHVLFLMWHGFDRVIEARVKYLLDAITGAGCDLIAHSAGCLLSHEAMLRGAEFRHVIWFAPAMDRDAVIPLWGCESLTVVYNPEDRAIGVGSLLPAHRFGAMGRFGHAHAEFDPRITNIKAVGRKWADPFRHSYSFNTPKALRRWAHFYRDLQKTRP